jgi:hypothetical protein
MSKVETWRELPGGQIEFTMKRLRRRGLGPENAETCPFVLIRKPCLCHCEGQLRRFKFRKRCRLLPMIGTFHPHTALRSDVSTTQKDAVLRKGILIGGTAVAITAFTMAAP